MASLVRCVQWGIHRDPITLPMAFLTGTLAKQIIEFVEALFRQTKAFFAQVM